MKMPWMIATVIVGALLAVAVMWVSRAFGSDMQRASGEETASLYDLQTNTLEGEPVELSIYQGQVALVVNTASKCGLTPQYEGLEVLYKELADQDFVILGFPSNDFMGQEPGSPEEIRNFCSTNYSISFPLFEKMTVKGSKKSEVYQVLSAELNEPSWNFTKYVVGRDGKVIARFGPKTAPDSPRLRDTIERALAVE